MRRGRPSKYQPKFAAQAAKLCELGATDIEIAAFFGVTTRTVYRWQNEFPEFCQSIKVAKATADQRVERSLYQKATGYTFESEKVFQHQGEIIRAPIVEHVPPSDTAMIFWLKNRCPEEWRDKRELEVRSLEKLTDDELDQRIAQLLQETESLEKNRDHKLH